MSTNFTEKQREVVARKMGYDGPMQMFDEYLASSPSDATRFAGITSKVAAKMAKGGLVRKMEAGGDVSSDVFANTAGLGSTGIGTANTSIAGADQTAVKQAVTLMNADIAKNTPLTAEQRATVVSMANQQAAAQGISPEQALYNYAQTQGLSNQNIDTMMGLPTNATQNWLGAKATTAPTSAPTAAPVLFDPTARASLPLTTVEKDAVVKEAQKIAAAQGISPEQALYNYAKTQGLSDGTVDQLMGFPAGTTASWKTQQTTAGKTTTTTPFSPMTETGAALPSLTTVTAQQAGAPAPIVATEQAATTTAATTAAATAAPITAPKTIAATTITPNSAQAKVQTELDKLIAQKGTVSEQAKITAQTGTVSKAAKAVAQKAEAVAPVVAGTRTTGEGELITPVTEATAIKAGVEQTAAPTKVEAAQGVVQANQLVEAAQIKEADMAQATAITAAGLAPDAVAVAKRLESFTVDKGTLAAAQQGDVSAQATVQGQLTELMKSFDDGATPAWAAGALRAANAALSSRGLGASSMASVAIFQAAMESALPIASQDAKTYADMGLSNLNNRQQTALSNAAAQQGLALQNLSNEQQAMLANSTNSFALQSQNLSNMQQTMLANTQIKAAFQGQNLSNMQQASVVNAARYAEQANINLNNVQQAALHNSSMQVQVDISNTSNRQQTSLANAQLEAALQGKILDNRQQAAVLNATRIAENSNLTFTAAQTAALHNSNVMKDVNIANLSAAQATVLSNAATAATMDIANLNNRQSAAVSNAKAFLEVDMKNLDLAQQASIIKTQQISATILSDTAAANAAKATNATNKIEVDRINQTLALTASQFNAAETNKVNIVNANAANELSKFNATEANNRAEFNASNAATINVANAKILADISTSNTISANSLAAVNAKNATDLSATVYAQQSTTYRDILQMSVTAGENEKNRLTNLAIATITSSATTANANIAADATSSAAIGGALVKGAEILASTDKGKSLISSAVSGVAGLFGVKL